MNITFRELSLEDLERAIELCDLCFEEKTDIETAKKIFEKNSRDENCFQIIGCTEDDKIVAFVRIQFIETLFSGMDTYAILNHVCVHPDYRRKHIGTAMLEHITSICRDKECVAMKLWSYNYRISSHALYKGFGFAPVDATFYTKEID